EGSAFTGTSDAGAFQEGLQLAAAAGVAQLAERLGLDLADALARDREILADLFERVLAAVAQAEAHLDDLLLARSQGLEQGLGLVLEVDVDHGLGGGDHVAVLDEVPQMRVLLLPDGRLE